MTMDELVRRVDNALQQMIKEKQYGEPEEKVLRRYRTEFINEYIDYMATIYKQ